MRLLLLPLLLSNALVTIDADSALGYPDSGIGIEEVTTAPPIKNKSNIIATTFWLYSSLRVADNDLKPNGNIVGEATSKKNGNKKQFKINITTTPTQFCNTTDGKEGKCVKPEDCEKILLEPVRITAFTYRELDCSPILPCCALSDIKVIPGKNKSLLPECGLTNPGAAITRNKDIEDTGLAAYAEFPWMIALLKKSQSESYSDNYFGGGSLIHPSVVLTAAHKVANMKLDELKCRAGEWNTETETEIYLHQDRNVRKIAIHSEFVWKDSHYNAALLFLVEPFRLENAPHIGLVCLGRHMPPPGTLCYGMGWGKSANDNNVTNTLKKIELPIVDSDRCQKKLRNAGLGSNFLLHHTQCCAGGEGKKDTCTNDGGSPLVCPVKSESNALKYAVFGIVAKGFGCFEQDLPAIYTNVASVVGWIDRRIGEEQNDKI